MPIDTRNARALLQRLDLNRLFVEELNWANPQRRPVTANLKAGRFDLKPVAEQGEMVVFEVRARDGEGIPDLAARKQVHKYVTDNQAHEHILVFINGPGTTTLWSWLRREDGKAPRPNEHRFHVNQPGDSLLQRLEGLAFEWEELDEDGRATIVQATERARAAFATNAERVTRRFYDEFKRQHDRFLKFIEGVDAVRDGEWYASVMLNRLMFLYFIQKKRFLDRDPAYLRNSLVRCQMERIPFYRGFLVPLFFNGLATQPDERTEEYRQLLGDIPYLNGGLFMPHQIEREATEGDLDPTPETIGIDIPDAAFDALFDFFDRYNWHLDDRPLRADNEINPDVLGYIFEKYINQKQMGAYYTKEDITEYISRNTVLPFLWDRLRSFRHDAVVPLPIGDIEPYIFEAVRKGVDLPLPDYIAAGVEDVAQRGRWNEAADPEFALPTETWREHIHRRERVGRIREAFVAGEIAEINDFITHNLDIVAFTRDFLSDTDDPLVIRAFYFECLRQVTILDPTCGSGAFLFAALNILEPLYEICLERMEEFLRLRQRHPQWATDFERELASLARHPSRNYFIYKSIVVNNLFGVDIMEEAVEICKLRLFLKLVAQVADPDQIEPLPDIDFNIHAGNTLVGYATYEQILEAKQPGAKGTARMDYSGIVDRVQAVDREVRAFRELQMQIGVQSDVFRERKENLRVQLRAVEAELNQDLALEYGFSADRLDEFIASHRPFHWYVEFNDILTRTPGGFDVIIGNPPYVERSQFGDAYQIRGYRTAGCPDIFAAFVEEATQLLAPSARLGMIVPISLVCADKFAPLQEVISPFDRWLANFSNRPSQLFTGAQKRLTILLMDAGRAARPVCRATTYRRWLNDERDALLSTIEYAAVDGLPSVFDYSIPKVGTPEGVGALQKALSATTRLDDLTSEEGKFCYHYVRTPGYFCQFFGRPPMTINKASGEERARGELYSDCFEDEKTLLSVVAVMNSSLFYLYYQAYSDCRHMNRRDVLCFPLDADLMGGMSGTRLAQLGEDLLAEFEAHKSLMRKSGLEIETFDGCAAKPVIDEIDRVLAEHYGFTAEELDFIINYDIKYRMGGADAGAED